MNFDFPTLLVAATFFTGLAWAVDAFAWAPRRRRRAEALVAAGEPTDSAPVADALKEPTWVEYSKSFFPVILAVLLLRSFLVEPFRIPSGSMMPTLLVGDFILVNKYTYGLRLPVLNTKIVELGEPERGDVVVFRYPKDPSVDYIKRVVGVPGDTVGYFDKVVYINGEPAGQVPAGVYVGTGSGVSMSARRILCCCLSTSRVRVSPSAIDTTLPYSRSATEQADHVSAESNRRDLSITVIYSGYAFKNAFILIYLKIASQPLCYLL